MYFITSDHRDRILTLLIRLFQSPIDRGMLGHCTLVILLVRGKLHLELLSNPPPLLIVYHPIQEEKAKLILVRVELEGQCRLHR